MRKQELKGVSDLKEESRIYNKWVIWFCLGLAVMGFRVAIISFFGNKSRINEKSMVSKTNEISKFYIITLKKYDFPLCTHLEIPKTFWGATPNPLEAAKGALPHWKPRIRGHCPRPPTCHRTGYLFDLIHACTPHIPEHILEYKLNSLLAHMLVPIT